MASGWEAFGGVLGGGVDRAGAFDQGRLRTAQTESAIQQAQERQLKNIAAEAQAAAIERVRRTEAAAGIDQVPLADIMESGYGNFDQAMGGRLKGQEYGLRKRISDPTADLADQIFAEQGITGKVRNPLEMMGSGNFVDLRALPAPGETPTLGTTPLGESMIDESVAQTAAANALADQRQRTPAGGGAGRDPRFDGVPSGWMVDPTDPTGARLVPRPGGPADPDAGGSPIGSIERRFLRRVTGAAENTISDLEVFLSMPSGVSVGRFGGSAGMRGEDKLLGALMYQAKYQMTPEDENMYNAALGGFSEQLRVMEAQGLRGAASTAAQFDALRFEPKDSSWARMFKLSRVRQTVENGIVPNLAAANLPTSERQYMEGLIQRVRTSIPFTPQDVMAWRAEQQRNPAITLGEVVDQRIAAGGGTPRGATPAPTPAPAGTPAPPPVPTAEQWERGPDGKLRRVQ